MKRYRIREGSILEFIVFSIAMGVAVATLVVTANISYGVWNI